MEDYTRIDVLKHLDDMGKPISYISSFNGANGVVTTICHEDKVLVVKDYINRLEEVARLARRAHINPDARFKKCPMCQALERVNL